MQGSVKLGFVELIILEGICIGEWKNFYTVG